MNAETCRMTPVVICESVLDHEFGGLTIIAAGIDPRRGGFTTYSKRCTRCGRPYIETRWHLPLDKALARVTHDDNN